VGEDDNRAELFGFQILLDVARLFIENFRVPPKTKHSALRVGDGDRGHFVALEARYLTVISSTVPNPWLRPEFPGIILCGLQKFLDVFIGTVRFHEKERRSDLSADDPFEVRSFIADVPPG